MTVVAPGELDDPVPPGHAARETNGRHRGLGPGRDQSEPLGRGHARPDRLGQLDLGERGCAEREPAPGRLLHRLDDGPVRMAQDRRTPGADVVDVAPAVCVPDMRSLTALEQQRRPRDGSEGTNRAVHTAREKALRLCDKRLRPGGGARTGRHDAPNSDRISPSGRWIPRRIGVSLTVERRLSVLRSARTRSPKATRSSVS